MVKDLASVIMNHQLDFAAGEESKEIIYVIYKVQLAAAAVFILLLVLTKACHRNKFNDKRQPENRPARELGMGSEKLLKP